MEDKGTALTRAESAKVGRLIDKRIKDSCADA